MPNLHGDRVLDDLRRNEVARLLRECQGVLLPGSPADVDPEKFGASRDPRTAPADSQREDLDALVSRVYYVHEPGCVNAESNRCLEETVS